VPSSLVARLPDGEVTGNSNLQMDTNFCVSSTTYVSLNQQSTNGEHPDQLVDYTKHKRLHGNRSYAVIASLHLLLVTTC